MQDIVIIDTETTGWDRNNDRIIEVGAIKVRCGEIVDEYSALIQSVEYIPDIITNVTGITLEDLVAHGEEPEKVFNETRDFIGDSVFVAHNVGFDYSFLNHEFHRYRITPLGNKSVCTVKLARNSSMILPNYKLSTIKQFLNLEYISHRALSDVMVCYELMKYLKYF